jgi:hypothetical protein
MPGGFKLLLVGHRAHTSSDSGLIATGSAVRFTQGATYERVSGQAVILPGSSRAPMLLLRSNPCDDMGIVVQGTDSKALLGADGTRCQGRGARRAADEAPSGSNLAALRALIAAQMTANAASKLAKAQLEASQRRSQVKVKPIAGRSLHH